MVFLLNLGGWVLHQGGRSWSVANDSYSPRQHQERSWLVPRRRRRQNTTRPKNCLQMQQVWHEIIYCSLDVMCSRVFRMLWRHATGGSTRREVMVWLTESWVRSEICFCIIRQAAARKLTTPSTDSLTKTQSTKLLFQLTVLSSTQSCNGFVVYWD